MNYKNLLRIGFGVILIIAAGYLVYIWLSTAMRFRIPTQPLYLEVMLAIILIIIFVVKHAFTTKFLKKRYSIVDSYFIKIFDVIISWIILIIWGIIMYFLEFKYEQ